VELKQETVERNNERYGRIMRLIPAESDTLSLVLKFHLVIEEELVRILNASVKYPEMLSTANLSFAQRLAITRALYDGKRDHGFWKAAAVLNKLRNELAHELEPDLLKFAAPLFASWPDYYQQFPDEQGLDITARLRAFLTFVVGGFVGIADRLEENVIGTAN